MLVPIFLIESVFGLVKLELVHACDMIPVKLVVSWIRPRVIVMLAITLAEPLITFIDKGSGMCCILFNYRLLPYGIRIYFMIHEDEMDAPSSRGPGVTYSRVLNVAAVDACISL